MLTGKTDSSVSIRMRTEGIAKIRERRRSENQNGLMISYTQLDEIRDHVRVMSAMTICCQSALLISVELHGHESPAQSNRSAVTIDSRHR